MQRHRVTHNVARSSQEDLDWINAFARDPEFKKKIEDALGEKPSDYGKIIRRRLTECLHFGESNVLFSRSEMDSGFFNAISMIRWDGCPGVFLTFSPSAVDNEFALRIVARGSDTLRTADYKIRSASVFGRPARAALYYETINKLIETALLNIPSRE